MTGLERYKKIKREAANQPLKDLPPPVEATLKHKLPILQDYNKEKFPASFWSKWRKRSLDDLLPGSSWVEEKKLRELADKSEFPHTTMLERVCHRLREGAYIGCEGRGRLPTRVKNSVTVYEFGDRISDTLQEGICEGIMAGPLREEELVRVGLDYTVNPLGAKLKPNGKIRVLVDASSPHDKEEETPGWIWNPEFPGSVNSTIDPRQFPTKMSSVPEFVRSLWKYGRNAVVGKLDYTSAYKHQHVREEDLKLQVIKWGDRYFVEMKLIFGSRSSPGIFDELAKVFLWSCASLVSIPKYAIQQHIDDVLVVGSQGQGTKVDDFYNVYVKEAEAVGIRLDASDNPDKQQRPAHTVTALGVQFNTVTWTWGLKEDKLLRILHSLTSLQAGNLVDHKTLESITGKLVDVKSLVPGGKFNLLHFLTAVHKAPRKYLNKVRVEIELEDQAGWWMTALKATTIHAPIIHPDSRRPSNAQEAWSDAAGGTREHMGAGLGVVTPVGEWAYIPWPTWLNYGGPNSDGVTFASKLSCLEMLGPLVALCMVSHRIAGEALIVYVDNQGSVDIYKRGHSTKCVYTSTIAKACHDLAWSLGATLAVEKVRRCSDAGSYLADVISKGELTKFRKLMPDRLMVSEVPVTVLEWIKDPRQDLHLGVKIAQELRMRGRPVVLLE